MVIFKVKRTKSGKIDDFRKALESKSLITIILGRRGAGKTALGYRLAEAMQLKRSIYILGNAPKGLPPFILPLDDIMNAKQGSIVLIDEVGIVYNSRRSMKKQSTDLAEMMMIARHLDLSLVLITQNSATTDINILRMCDIIIFKEPSLLQTRFERRAIAKLYSEVKSEFKWKPKYKYAYVFSDLFSGLVETKLPEFWSDKISKSYGDRNEKD